MTAVEPATATAALEAEAAAFEASALAEVAGPLAEQVTAAVASITVARATAVAAGTIGRTAVLPAVAAARVTRVAVEVLQSITSNLRPELERQAAVAVDLGRRHAAQAGPVLDELEGEVTRERLLEGEPEPEPADGGPEPAPTFEPPAEPELDLDALADADPELADVIESVDIRAQGRLDEAVELAEQLPMSTKGDVDAVVAKAEGAVHGVRRDTAWVTARAQSIGAQAEADETTGGGLLWISERWACLGCLALSGQVAHDGEDFAGEDFGDHPLAPVPYPPAHPHCKCRTRPYDGPSPERDMSATDPASVLAREARRSVLRGWSAYDSEAARLRAAEALLDEDPALPKSVVDRARRNVDAGEFARDGGRFPDPPIDEPPPLHRRPRPTGPMPPDDNQERGRRSKPAAQPEPTSAAAPPPAPEPPVEPERSPLEQGLASGERSTRVLSGGQSGARVELIEFNDETKAVRKVIVPTDTRDVAHQIDAEALGAALSRAVGIPAPDTIREDNDTLLMSFMDGHVPDGLGARDIDRLAETDQGKVLGLVDLLMANPDRHGGNVLLDPDERIIGGIDTAWAFAWDGVSNPAMAPENATYFQQGYVSNLTPTGRWAPTHWADNDLTPADIGRVRARLQDLRGEFEAAGRESWFDSAMARLTAIEPHAKGTKDLTP